MMKFLTDNALLAIDVSEPLLVGFLAVLVVLIVLLTVIIDNVCSGMEKKDESASQQRDGCRGIRQNQRSNHFG